MEHLEPTKETIVALKEDWAADFDKNLFKTLGTVWSHTETDLLNSLSEHSDTITGEVIKIGNHSQQHLANTEQPDTIHYQIMYDWLDKAKSFLILWRDVVFELQKGHLSLKEGFISSTDFEKLCADSRNALENAASDIRLDNASQQNSIIGVSRELKKWKHQNTPWPVYRKQMEAIPRQCKRLLEQHELTLIQSEHFNNIKEQFHSINQSFLLGINGLHLSVNEILENSSGNEEDFNGKQVVQSVEQLQLDSLSFNDLDGFGEQLDKHLDLLSIRKQFSVSTDNGLLLTKDIDIHRNAANWLDSEIMSDIHNIYQSHSGLQNKLNLTRMNIRNRFDFEKTEGHDLARKEIVSAMGNLQKSIEKTKADFLESQEEMQEILKKDLNASGIYSGDFLPISMSSTFNQYRKYQVQGFNRVREWIDEKGIWVKSLRKEAQKEDTLSHSEKIVRMVRHRMPHPALVSYTNMFLTQGYIGETFCVGRQEELERMAKLVDNWKMGFRGAVLFTGPRFSGKSLIGSLIQHIHFPGNHVKLSPKTSLIFEGRRKELGYDLKEALEFIIKYGLRKPHLVWIDDLELWENDKISLSENVKHLLHYIDQYSNKMFFMVSCSHAIKTQLNRFHEMDKVFQSEIALDKMSFNDIREIILIRHNATQFGLLDDEGEELEMGQLDKLIKRIYQSSKGNVGEALKKWAYTMTTYDEDQVTPRSEYDYPLTEFMSMEAAMILRSIMVHKYTNEYKLRKKFGPAFKTIYKPILNRLFHLGLLKRHLDGTMEINPFVVNDIGRLLSNDLDFPYTKGNSNKEKI